VFETLNLSNLPKRAICMLMPPSSTRPAIWVVEEHGKRAVVKDFSAQRFVIRNTMGRFLVWREARAYRRLSGVQGVPVFYGTVDGMALVVEQIFGRSLENLEQNVRLPEAFFDELQALVDCFHSRGLAHCDLKRSANTLVSDQGHPWVVDWAASISETECRGPLLKRIYRRFLRDDDMAVIKLKLRHIPEAVRDEEKARYAYRPGWEKAIRRIRDQLRKLLQKAA